MKFGIMAVDPGGTSGVATGLFNTKGPAGRSTRALLARAVEKDAIRVEQIYGGPDYKTVGYDTGHVHRVLGAWISFNNRARALGAERVDLVIEDFQLRQRSVDLAPVQITAGLECLIVERPHSIVVPIKQPASEAMGYATNVRLKEWRVYPLTVGKEHARDALRHLVLRASKRLEEL